VAVKSEEQLGTRILMLNSPDSVAVDMRMWMRAYYLGTTNLDGQVLQLWDHGKPHLVPVVVTNKVPALKPTSGAPTNQSGSNSPAH
jgi:hypothetical protein